VISGLNTAITLYDRLKGKPSQPPAEQLQQSLDALTHSVNASNLVISERVSGLEDWKETLTAKLESDKSIIIAEDERRSSKIHDRVDDVLKAVSHQSGVIEGLKEALTRVQADVRTILYKKHP